MRKFLVFFAVLSLCVLILFACGAPQEQSSPSQTDLEQSSQEQVGQEPVNPEPDGQEQDIQVRSKRDSIPFSEGQLYAVAYLGYQ